LGQTAYQHIATLIARNSPNQFRLASRDIDLKSSDQAIVTTFIVKNETVSVERVGPLVKLLLRTQIARRK
jgi:hypothetical protein